jgi:hypothetical protein
MKLMSDNISTISAALLKAQRVMGNASKDSKNPFFKSKYADLNAVREAVLPPLNENGISVIQPTIFHEGKKFVQTIFLHESGEYISGLTEILAVKETDAQAQGSGISYARRYGLQSLANIGAEDDDGNAASDKKVEKQEKIVKEVKTTTVDKTFTPEDKMPEPTPVEQKTETPKRRSFRTL